MARSARTDIGEYPYHVINRGIGRLRIFSSAKDHSLFLELLVEAAEELDMWNKGDWHSISNKGD